jgi:hypothetical protein
MACSAFAGVVTADNAIAAPLAALQPVFSNGVAPTAVISAVRKDGWTIATGSGRIGADGREPA